MEKQSLINKITTIVDELKDLTSNFNENDNIPQIDIDLSLEKVRKLYDKLNKLKSVKPESMEDSVQTINNIVKEESISEVESKIEVPEPIVEKIKEEVIEELVPPIVEYKEEPKEEIIEQVTPEIIETKPETFNTNIRTNASQTSLFESSNETYKNEDIIEENIQEEITETISPVVEYTPEPIDENIEEIPVEEEKQEEIINNENPFNFDENIQEDKPEVLFKEEEEKEEVINEIKEEIPQAKTTVGENYIDNKKNINDYFAEFKKTKDLATHLQYQPIKNLKSVISLNDKIRFIKELFGSSSEKYAISIEKLDSFSNLDEALDYLNSNFEWDDTKASFKDFIELIYRRYLPVLN